MIALFVGCGSVPEADGPEARGATVVVGAEVACDDPDARTVARFDRVELPVQPRPELANLTSAGIVAADLDLDGRPDLLLPHEVAGESDLWLGTDGGYVSGDDRIAGIDLEGAVGGSAADYDGDGDLDVLVTRWERPIVLLRNDGGWFADATVEAGLDGKAWKHQSATWGDVDADGDLDLYVGGYGIKPDDLDHDDPDLPPADPDALWLNRGDGTFADGSDGVPPEVHDGYTFHSSLLDVDGDALPELFVWNDFGTSFDSQVLHNDGGTFSYVPGVSGIDRDFESMGVGIADLDRDGLPDFAVSSWKEALLLLSERSSASHVGATWIDATAAHGLVVEPDDPLEQQVYGWGTELADLDSDRDDDLVMLFGYWSQFPGAGDPVSQADGLWLQQRDGEDFVFEDRASDPEWSLRDTAVSRGLVVADLDRDGFLDVAKRFLGWFDGTDVVAAPPVVYASRCGDAAWTRVALRQDGANVHAVGARVAVTSPDGLTQVRWVSAGSTSLSSSGPPEAHFGLGDDLVFDVEVTWPDGFRSTVRGVPPRRPITIHRSER